MYSKSFPNIPSLSCSLWPQACFCGLLCCWLHVQRTKLLTVANLFLWMGMISFQWKPGTSAPLHIKEPRTAYSQGIISTHLTIHHLQYWFLWRTDRQREKETWNQSLVGCSMYKDRWGWGYYVMFIYKPYCILARGWEKHIFHGEIYIYPLICNCFYAFLWIWDILSFVYFISVNWESMFICRSNLKPNLNLMYKV